MDTLDGGRPIVLRCSGCDTFYDWAPQPDQTPGCPRCSAAYSMGCYDCGLDLLVDGFEARSLKPSSEPEGRAVSGLFCPECADRYDHFAVGESRSVPCARCGAQVPAGQLRLRSVSKSEVAGAVVMSQTRFEGVCSACAAEADGGGTPMWLLGAIGACLLAGGMAGILFGMLFGSGGVLVTALVVLVSVLVLVFYEAVTKGKPVPKADRGEQWGCSRCGSVNPSESRTCGACGLEV